MSADKKEEFVANILNQIAPTLTNDQLKHLKNILYINLSKYNLTEQETSLTTSQTQSSQTLNLFLQTKLIEGKSQKTISRYKDILTPMLITINKPIPQITTWDLRAYLAQYKESRKVCDNTLDGMRRIISSFFTWLTVEKYISENPALRLQKIKVEKKVKNIIEDEQLELLRIATTNDRDLALIDLLYASGMRVGELAALNISDINFVQKSIVVHGKGNKQRRIFFNGSTKVRLEKYLATRSDYNPALFVTLRNNSKSKEPSRLSIKAIEHRIANIANKAGLTKIYPHMFRRSMATNMAKKNIPVNKIAYLLGHEKISTTQEYLVNNELDIENSYRMCFG